MRIIYVEDKNEIKRILEDFPWWEAFRKSKFCVVAEEDERVIGACSLAGVFNTFPLYVVEEYRGLGIGRLLVGNLIRIAKKKNYSFILSIVGWGTSPNIPVRKVVQKLHFRKVIDIGNRTIIFFPLKETISKLVFISARVFFSLIPPILHERLVEWASIFTTYGALARVQKTPTRLFYETV